MDSRRHISVDPNVCHGKACIQGTRVPVTVILDNLAVGQTLEQIVMSYPSLSVDDVRASLSFAAELAADRLLSLPHAKAD
jgi:uncharacterized protein (DUF433 family)